MSDLQFGGCPNCGKSSCVAMACKSGDLHQAIINIKVPKILDALLAAAELALERDRRIAELEAALQMAVTQNEHDMLMTGDELRECSKLLKD